MSKQEIIALIQRHIADAKALHDLSGPGTHASIWHAATYSALGEVLDQIRWAERNCEPIDTAWGQVA